MKSPLAAVKETFGDKKKLVEAVEKFTGEELWVARTSKDKGLAHVSNAKLLKLHATFTAVKEKFGTRDKLIDAIVALEKRTKDAGYRAKIAAYPVPRLWDLFQVADKRVASAAKAAKKAPAAKAAAPKPEAKKVTAKKAAAPKPAAKKK